MEWLEITVQTASAGIEQAAQSLTAAGFSDLVMEDQQEFQEFLDENREYWDYVDEKLQKKLEGLSCIKLYIEKDDRKSLDTLEALLEKMRQEDREKILGSLTMTAVPLQEENWEESWKENYPPQPVGEHLVVLPCWLRDQAQEGQIPVILDPGLTFGTGAHPSTQMVMEVMEQTVTPGCACLDLGSGSGILSITALRLGAGSAIGVDIDPKAEDIARENAAYNGLQAPAFQAMTGNVTADRQLMERLSGRHYDLVLVNIVADVIIGLAPVLPEFLDESSTLILSGILDVRLQDVLDALQKAGLEPVEVRQKEDWRCVKARRRQV